MIDGLKEVFAWFYKRFTWGYQFGGAGVQLFNFVGILLILFRVASESFSRWVLVPFFLLVGLFVCVGLGWFMFDLLKLKTKFTRQEGLRDDYWSHQLSPIQQKMLLVYLEAVKNPKKLKFLEDRVKSGRL